MDDLETDIITKIDDALYVFHDSACISPTEFADLLLQARNKIKHLRLELMREREKDLQNEINRMRKKC